MNQENLDKLATYLEQLPVDYKHFDMEGYYDKDHQLTREQALDYALNNGGVDKFDCGTVACAVGHGPAAGILLTLNETTIFGAPDWDRYSKRFADGGDFEWLFSSYWADMDNTHRGAAARIRYLLAGNEIPDYRDFPEPEDVEDVAALLTTYAEYLVS